MTREEIQKLARNLTAGEAKIIETHISWVLLSEDRAYKIKKTIKLPFLDFSDLEQRRGYCEREVSLNRRLAPEVYLGVQPIREEGEKIWLGPGSGKVIDYAVEMVRLESALEMPKMLAKGAVNPESMRKLAVLLAAFHRNAPVIDHGETAAQLIPLFNDIRSEEPDIELLLGTEWHDEVEDMIKQANSFLITYEPLFCTRIRRGFIRDCHGDLHCGNIFMYPEPVVFDCIEFRDEFRQIDVLHEVAFLCMDLEVRGYADLATVFLENWLAAFQPPDDFFHEKLFAFYKCYMANVRAKVTAMRRGSGNDEVVGREVKGYLELMREYLGELL